MNERSISQCSRAPLGAALALIVLSSLAGCEPSGVATPCEQCSGCCSNGTCLAGTANDACGIQGDQCKACGDGQSCVNGTCVVGTGCGCRDSLGQCQPGTADTACGNTGGVCLACPSGQRCIGGVCGGDTCTYQNCNGCCMNGRCVEQVGPAACGARGSICVTCTVGQTCVLGECAVQQGCSSGSCSGCCAQDACLSGTTDSACGVGGEICARCNLGEGCRAGTCVAIGTGSCGPTNCNGCCDFNGTCHPADQQNSAYCGLGGQACASCGDVACISGSCATPGSACLATCTSGCCTLDGFCVPYTEQSVFTCGISGLCTSCPTGAACVAGSCASSDATWKVYVMGVRLAERDLEGSDWDSDGSPPDPYVTAQFPGWLQMQAAWPPASNTFNASFGVSGVLLLSGTESTLTAAPLEIAVKDNDSFLADLFYPNLFDDLAGTCSLNISSSMLASGSYTITQCGEAASSLQLRFTP